jgi:diadenosine tetraphosphatase ApaH/serine/threonine PP2A family protein phosphatase
MKFAIMADVHANLEAFEACLADSKEQACTDYFVNVGAVGQPRDNNPKAAYVVYNLEQGTIELRRMTYDIARTQRKIRDAGLGA